MRQANNPKKRSGFTLIELLITVGILSIISVTFLNAYTTNITTAKYSRIKTIATSIAQEKMEELKNLPYNSLSTQNGTIIPQGTILDQETITNNGMIFKTHTIITYYDDLYDGCAQYIDSGSSKCADGSVINKAQDNYPYDYKKATIKVFDSTDTKLLAETSTNLASHAAETTSNTGILAISVINATGSIVPDATITVTNTTLTPAINITTQSNQDMYILIPLLMPADQSYHIEVSKVGYNSASTYPITSENPNPLLPDVSILTQKVTNVTLAIDELAQLQITTKDANSNLLPNQNLTIQSKKSIDTAGNIPKYSIRATTNAQGYYSNNQLEWGTYSIITESGNYILTSVPYLPVLINPNQIQPLTLHISTDSSKMRISSLSPINAPVSGGNISCTLTGDNLQNVAAVVLEKNPDTPIQATNIQIDSEGQTMTFNIDISSANTGNWQLKLTKTTEELIQDAAFIVN